ncbi:hypothetical protein BJV74DRAFT_891843 [Russula compacta]|nr:hypothetical protein BJV74DRAFT_891843 [Russula compacta]
MSLLHEQDNIEDDISVVGSDKPSDTLVSPVTDEPADTPPRASAVSEELPAGLRQRKKVQGYRINSEEERSGGSDYCFKTEEMKPCGPWEPPIFSVEPHAHLSDSLKIRACAQAPSTISIILPLSLPLTYATNKSSSPRVHHSPRVHSTPSHTTANYARRKLIQTSTVFWPDCYPSGTMLVHHVAAAIGLFIDVWFIFAYSGADVHKFHTLAVDIYGSYFFFALSLRLPLVALFVSVLALVGFLSAIAWTAWPTAVLVMCVLTGALITLQFIVYGFHCLAGGLAWMLRGAWLGVVYVTRRVREVFMPSQAGQEVEVGLQAPATTFPAPVHTPHHAGHTT